MADAVNYDDMDDDAFMAAIEQAAEQPNDIEEEEETFEDTDLAEETEDETEVETETNEADDDELDDTGEYEDETDEDDEEENAQVDEYSESEEDEADADAETEDEDETETEDETEDDESEESEADEINYQEEYQRLMEQNSTLQGFYDEVTSEFTANGKKMKGFNDPKKIIQSMQMAAGFSDKMAGFKPYRPFMSTLKEKGMLEDPEKFNLAMNLLDGDSEALKQHLKNLDIDPFEMDMDNINYENKNQVSSNIEIAYDDLIENAKRSNAGEKVQQIISKDWDDQSVIELLEDTQSSADLVHHINSGAYDLVQERIAEKKRVDLDSVYSSKPAIQQYREAAGELEAEYAYYMQNNQSEQANAQQEQEIDPGAVEAEKAKIAENRKATEYRKKVEKQNAKADAARKKATSVSKKKPRSKPKKQFDPGEASDEEFTAYMDNLIFPQG